MSNKNIASKQAILERRARIMDCIEQGMTSSEIFNRLSREEKVSPRTIERTYYQIIDEMAMIQNEHKNELRATILARQEYIYKRAVKNNNMNLALRCLGDIAKVGGLFDQKAKEETDLPKVIEYYDTTPLKAIDGKKD